VQLDTQREFAGAVLDPQRPVPESVAARGGAAAARRFAVYRNNVVAGLVNALRARFPVLEAVLGAECFAATAHLFAVTQPPRSPLMMFYGDAFPDFLAGFAPLADIPYLADVGRLEAARTHAFHAADATPVAAATLQGLAADALFGLHIGLHPSLQIVCSRHPVVTIWAMNSGEAALGSIDGLAAEDALVIRAQATVRVHRLPTGAAAFLRALARETLGGAANAAAAQQPGFDLAAGLAVLIESGAVIALHPEEALP
jgi:hypothetical protein